MLAVVIKMLRALPGTNDIVERASTIGTEAEVTICYALQGLDIHSFGLMSSCAGGLVDMHVRIH